MGETAQALVAPDDGGRVSRCWIRRRLGRDVAVELLQPVVSCGGEDGGVGHPALAEVNGCAAASPALTRSTLTAWDGSDLSASSAAATSPRSQSSTARSRARRAPRPSRITSLSVACSPAATLALTASAIGFGSVMLNCWVERVVTWETVSKIKSYPIPAKCVRLNRMASVGTPIQGVCSSLRRAYAPSQRTCSAVVHFPDAG